MEEKMKISNLPIVIWKSIKITWGFSKGPMVGLAIVGILTSFLPLIQTRLLGDLVNRFTEVIEAGSFPIILIIAYSSIWALARISNSLQQHFDQIWSITVSNGLEMEIMKTKSSLDIAKHDDPDFQDLVQRASNRGIWPIINTVDATFSQVSNTTVLIVAAIAAASMNWLVFVITVVALIPSLLFQLKHSKSIYCIWMTNSPFQRVFSHLKHHLTSRFALQQNKTIQATGNLLSRAEKILNKFKMEQFKVINNRLFQIIIASIIAGVGFTFALILLIKDVMAGKILLGDMVFLIGALGYFIGSLNMIFSSLSNQYEHSLVAKDIFEIFEQEPIIRCPEHPKKLELSQAPVIEFRNVSFRYPDTEEWILKDINLVVESGEKLAIVGENGAGKTTLIKLLARIYDPTKGDIFVNGVNLRSVDPDNWMKYLAILFQRFTSFDFTTEESIAMGRADRAVNSRKVRQAASLASAHDFIAGWKGGYKQQLGREFKGGIDPSRGQEQKLAIARTIYRGGWVIVFDEPTASVDALSEARIFREIDDVTSNRTLFLISHRFNTVRSVDRIIVIDKGTIVEDGSHEQLILQKGLYACMFNEQAESYMVPSCS